MPKTEILELSLEEVSIDKGKTDRKGDTRRLVIATLVGGEAKKMMLTSFEGSLLKLPFEYLAIYDCRQRPALKDKASTARTHYIKYNDLSAEASAKEEYPDRWSEITSMFSKPRDHFSCPVGRGPVIMPSHINLNCSHHHESAGTF